MGSAFVKELKHHQKKAEHPSILDLSHRSLKQEKNFKSVQILANTLKELTVSFNGLIDLPDELKNLKKLKMIDFSNNAINYFPPNLPATIEKIYAGHNRLFYSPITPLIGNLSNLEMLDLGNNQLEELPDEFSNLSRLQELLLNNNSFTVFPESVYKLKSLQSLDLSNNKVTEVGDQVSNLLNIKVIKINANALAKLSENIGKCSKITTLNLSENLLKSLPNSIGELHYLEVLLLNENPHLHQLPSSAHKNVMLTNLDIRNTSISDLLSTMRRNPWVNLRELLLGSNKQFFALPDFLFLSQEEGGKLSKLECGDCNLKSLPHNLGHLGASLLHLDLKKNQLSSFAIPPSISLLINLATLNLSYNNIEAIPDELSELTNLIELDLSNNLLQVLPDDFGNLPKLNKLLLNNNKLESLPQSITNLRSLETMEVRLNILSSIPIEIGDLHKLTHLDLSRNRLQQLPTQMYLMEALTSLDLGENPFDVPPQPIIVQGCKAVLQYLRLLHIQQGRHEQVQKSLSARNLGSSTRLGSSKALKTDGSKANLERDSSLNKLGSSSKLGSIGALGSSASRWGALTTEAVKANIREMAAKREEKNTQEEMDKLMNQKGKGRNESMTRGF